MCRSGGRSAKAVNFLAEAGFKNVYNIVDGYLKLLRKGAKVPDSVLDTINEWLVERLSSGL